MEGAGKGSQQKEKNFVGKEGRIVVGSKRVPDMTKNQGTSPNGVQIVQVIQKVKVLAVVGVEMTRRNLLDVSLLEVLAS